LFGKHFKIFADSMKAAAAERGNTMLMMFRYALAERGRVLFSIYNMLTRK